VTDPLSELAELEARRAELQNEQDDLDRHRTELHRDKADLEARLAGVSDIDDARKLEAQLREVDLWHRVIDNRGPAVQRELLGLGQQITVARTAANRHRVAELLVAADAVMGEILTGIDNLAELRRRAVESGAPSPLLAPPSGEEWSESRVRSDVIAFELVDRLAAYLRGKWAEEILPNARQDLEQ